MLFYIKKVFQICTYVRKMLLHYKVLKYYSKKVLTL